ncbi:MAG: HD domain-containing protein [Methanosarcinaceae archaeon]|nr:HD domain-containing protein [Methanosarcinaceae archaeon]
MDLEQLTMFYRWFDNYVVQFYSNDPDVQINFELKGKHTKRVCDNIILLSRSFGLSSEQMYLAELIALFHDVGRFEQMRMYRTFRDSDSEDHGQLGVRILNDAGILTSLSEDERDIILKAVGYHNRFVLPADETDKCLLYCKLIRDADKLDVLKVVTDYHARRDECRNPALELGLPDGPGYSKEMVREILGYDLAHAYHMRTYNDMKLLQLSWLFDVNFQETFRQISKAGYVDKLISRLPDTLEIRQIHEFLNAYLVSQLEN